MGSKFQHRLVGTVVLVALGVLLLPPLLDGRKQAQSDDFTSVPLIIPNGIMPNTPTATRPKTPLVPSQTPSTMTENTASLPVTVPNIRQEEMLLPPTNTPENREPTKNETPPLIQEKPIPTETPPVLSTPKPPVLPPLAKGYVVQLGALTNVNKVNEIIATLRLSGYRVFTVPDKPLAGKLTRILVGPEVSRQKLQAALPELNQLTGLHGQIKPYAPEP